MSERDGPKRYITMDVDIGGGPHHLGYDLDRTEITVAEIGRLFDDAKLHTIDHWAKLKLTEKLGRGPSDLEVAAALGHLSAESLRLNGASESDIEIVTGVSVAAAPSSEPAEIAAVAMLRSAALALGDCLGSGGPIAIKGHV